MYIVGVVREIVKQNRNGKIIGNISFEVSNPLSIITIQAFEQHVKSPVFSKLENGLNCMISVDCDVYQSNVQFKLPFVFDEKSVVLNG